jgi:hypothetical protein
LYCVLLHQCPPSRCLVVMMSCLSFCLALCHGTLMSCAPSYEEYPTTWATKNTHCQILG